MISASDYIFSTVLYALSIASGCAAGFFLFKKASLFLSFFLGLAFTEIIIVFFYSVILTEGKTIFILLIMPALLLISFKKEKTGPAFNKNFTSALLIKFCLTILAGLLFGQIFINLHYFSVFTQTTLPGLSDDYIYYSNLANFLNTYHTEAYLMLYTSKDFFSGIELFHYFDIWLTAFYIRISGLNAVCAYASIVLPLLQFTVLLGVAAIIESWTKTEIHFVGFVKWSLLFLLLSGISFWVPSSLASRLHFDSYANSFLVTILKLNVIYIGLLFALLGLTKNSSPRMYYFTASFMFLIISYTVLLPVFLLAYFLFAFIEWFTDIVNRKTIVKSSFALVLFIFIYLVFTQHYGSVLRVDNSLISFILSGIKKSAFYITSFHILFLVFFFTLIWFGIYFLSAIPILPILKKNRIYRSSLILLTSCFLSGVFSWCLFHPSENSVQLWVNIYLPVMNLFTFLITYLVLEKPKYKFRNYWVLLLIILSVTENISALHHSSANDQADKKFYVSLKAFLQSNSSTRGIRASVLVNGKSLKNFFDRSVNVDHPLMQLEAYFPYFFYDNLSVMEINFAPTPDEEPILLNSAFYQFVQKEKSENRFDNIPQSQVNFIRTYKIPYLIVGKNAPENPFLKKYYSNIFLSPDSNKFIVLDEALFNK